MKNSNRNRNKKGGFFKELFGVANDVKAGDQLNGVDVTTDDISKLKLDSDGNQPAVAADLNEGTTIYKDGEAMNVDKVNVVSPPPGKTQDSYNVITSTPTPTAGGARRGGARRGGARRGGTRGGARNLFRRG